MTDDLERRLRRALAAEADRAVTDDQAIPPMRVDESSHRHLHIVPMLSAAALVLTVAGGSAVLVGYTGHHPHGPVASETRSTSWNPTDTRNPTGTGSLPAPSTTANRATPEPGHPTSSAPNGSPRSTNPQPTSGSAQHGPVTTTPLRTHLPSGHVAPTHVPATGGPSTSVPSAPKSSTTPAPKPGLPCTTAELTLAIGGDRMVGTAGGDYTILYLTNTGPSCTLDGYPSIAIFDGSGAKIGGPAAPRTSPAPQRVTLATGGRAEVDLYDWNDSAPNCTANPDAGRTLQFTPPGQHTAIAIGYGYSACQLSVTSIHP